MIRRSFHWWPAALRVVVVVGFGLLSSIAVGAGHAGHGDHGGHGVSHHQHCGPGQGGFAGGFGLVGPVYFIPNVFVFGSGSVFRLPSVAPAWIAVPAAGNCT